MTEQLTTRALEFVYYDARRGATFKTTCPACGHQVFIPQFGKTTCPCGRAWQIDIVANPGQVYQLGPSETKR